MALGAVAGVVAIVAFCVLAAAGLPILGRYLLAPGDDPGDLLRSGRLRMGRAPTRASVAPAMGLVRGRHPRGARRVHPAPGGPHRQPARCAAHPGRDPGRPARPHAAFPVHAGHGAQSPPGAAAGAVARRRGRSGSRSPRSTGRAAGPMSCRRSSRVARQYILDPRDVNPASRRPRRGSGPSGRTRRGAPSPNAESGPCTLPRNSPTSACAPSGSGTEISLCARRDPLGSLPSGPDLIHRPTSRGTPGHRRRSRRADPTGLPLRKGIRPR